jgi:hypothetical protein
MIEHECGSLEQDYFSAFGGVSGQKSRTPPNTCICRFLQEPAPRTTEKRPARHEDTIFLCWYFIHLSKRAIMKLGGFTYAFAEKPIQ